MLAFDGGGGDEPVVEIRLFEQPFRKVKRWGINKYKKLCDLINKFKNSKMIIKWGHIHRPVGTTWTSSPEPPACHDG